MNRHSVPLTVGFLLFLGSTTFAWPPRLDLQGDPLPNGAIARFGTTRGRHTTAILRVDWLQDGKLLLSHSADGATRAWDSATGRAVSLVECFRYSADVHLLLKSPAALPKGLNLNSTAIKVHAVSPTHIATVGPDRCLRLLDAASGKELWTYQVQVCLANGSLAFSPDGKTLAVAEGTPAVTLLDVATGRRRELTKGHTHFLTALALSPDARQLASAGHDQNVRLWSIASGRCEQSWHLPNKTIKALAFSRDSRLVAAGTITQKTAVVHLWDTATGKERSRCQIAGHANNGIGLSTLSFAPDGRTLHAMTTQGLHSWDIVDGKSVSSKLLDVNPWIGRAISVDGKLQASTSSRLHEMPLDLLQTGSGMPYAHYRQPPPETITLQDLATGAELAQFQVSNGLRGMHDLDFTYGSEHSFPKHQWTRQSWHLPRTDWDPEFSGDGRLLRVHVSPETYVVDIATGRVLWQQILQAVAMRFSADGRLIHCLTPPGKLRIYDAWTAALRGEILLSDRPDFFALSADSRWLATGHHDTSILLWDLTATIRPAAALEAAPEVDWPQLWSQLGGADIAADRRALDRLSATPKAVAFLEKQLDAMLAKEARIDRLIQDLDSRRYSVRETAMRTLQELGALARPALQAVLANQPSLEMRRRIEKILQEVSVPNRLIPVGDLCRGYRAVHVLELLNTPEARKLLSKVAEGSSHSPLSTQGKAVLRRLDVREQE